MVTDTHSDPAARPDVVGHASPAELASLADLSARIGRDITLTQGPGGNTSVKIGPDMWIKASGTWLAHADTAPIFARIATAPVRDVIAGGGDAAAIDTVIRESAVGDRRPSIETSLHVLMPHPVVIHVHSVDILATVVRRDGEAVATRALADLASAWVPYRRPGAPLTEAVRDVLRRGPADVLLLANHGPVVGADSVEAAERLLREVIGRFAASPRPLRDTAPDTSAAEAMARLGYRPVRHSAAHGLAHDPAIAKRLRAGAFYPDQVVFLGPELPLVDDLAAADELIEAVRAGTGRTLPAIVIAGTGVFVATDADVAVDEQLAGHAAFLARLADDADVTTLTDEDVGALTNWEAEAYRRKLQARA